MCVCACVCVYVGMYVKAYVYMCVHVRVVEALVFEIYEPGGGAYTKGPSTPAQKKVNLLSYIGFI